MAWVEDRRGYCVGRWEDEYEKVRSKKLWPHTTAKHRMAFVWATKIEDEARELRLTGNIPQPKTPMTVLVDRYREFSQPRKTPETWQTEAWRYPRLLASFPEYVQDVTRGQIEDYMTKRREAGAAAATVNNEFALLSNMFTKARHWGYLPNDPTKDPTKGIEKFKDTVERERFLTVDEFRRLMRELHPKIKPIILAKLYTALRMKNILNLTWKQVDLDRDMIVIRHTKNKQPLIQPMIEPLKALLLELPRISPYVFPSDDGQPYKRIIKGFRAACKRAVIEDFHPHDMRHTVGTHLVANGVDIRTLQELLGHKTLKMTLRYVQVITENKRKSMEIIGRIFDADDANGYERQDAH